MLGETLVNVDLLLANAFSFCFVFVAPIVCSWNAVKAVNVVNKTIACSKEITPVFKFFVKILLVALTYSRCVVKSLFIASHAVAL